MQYVLPNTVVYVLIVGVGGYVLSFFLAWIPLPHRAPRPRSGCLPSWPGTLHPCWTMIAIALSFTNFNTIEFPDFVGFMNYITPSFIRMLFR